MNSQKCLSLGEKTFANGNRPVCETFTTTIHFFFSGQYSSICNMRVFLRLLLLLSFAISGLTVGSLGHLLSTVKPIIVFPLAGS